MMRFVCLAANALLGASFLGYAIVNPAVGPAGRREELVFFLMVAALSFAVAAGLAYRIRWLTVIPAIPLLLASLVFALMIGAGGWPWDGSPAAALAITLLETATIVLARRARTVPAP